MPLRGYWQSVFLKLRSRRSLSRFRAFFHRNHQHGNRLPPPFATWTVEKGLEVRASLPASWLLAGRPLFPPDFFCSYVGRTRGPGTWSVASESSGINFIALTVFFLTLVFCRFHCIRSWSWQHMRPSGEAETFFSRDGCLGNNRWGWERGEQIPFHIPWYFYAVYVQQSVWKWILQELFCAIGLECL